MQPMVSLTNVALTGVACAESGDPARVPSGEMAPDFETWNTGSTFVEHARPPPALLDHLRWPGAPGHAMRTRVAGQRRICAMFESALEGCGSHWSPAPPSDWERTGFGRTLDPA